MAKTHGLQGHGTGNGAAGKQEGRVGGPERGLVGHLMMHSTCCAIESLCGAPFNESPIQLVAVYCRAVSDQASIVHACGGFQVLFGGCLCWAATIFAIMYALLVTLWV